MELGQEQDRRVGATGRRIGLEGHASRAAVGTPTIFPDGALSVKETRAIAGEGLSAEQSLRCSTRLARWAPRCSLGGVQAVERDPVSERVAGGGDLRRCGAAVLA
jgi:hypothetical protein